MEFVQSYPVGVAEPGLASRMLPANFLFEVRLEDVTGADPMTGQFEAWGIKIGEEANLYARDRVAVVLARHVAAGHDFYLHTEEYADPRFSDRKRTFVRAFVPPAFDPLKGRVRVALTQHYFCGGVAISKRGEVLDRGGLPIPGLFACGEVTAGVDGTNRVGGNALVNITVFGLAAGEAAAGFAATAGAAGVGWAEGERVQPGAARVSATSPSPQALRRRLHDLTDRYLGLVRSETSLKEVLGLLAELETAAADGRRAALAGVFAAPSDTLVALEAAPAVATATYVARAALVRTESRGAHFREDLPAEDQAWSDRHTAQTL